jgi:pimeloyl-ACP methyl ester carboxylesterase
MAAPLTPHDHGTTILEDGRHIGWASFGDPEGDPVFWFHGSPGGRAQLPGDIESVALEMGFRIIGVERPGTGHSTKHRYTSVRDFVHDFEQVADDLGAKEFACVGLSGGGPFVLAVAHDMPERMKAGVVLGGIGPTQGIDAIVSYTLALVPAAPVLEKIADFLGDATSKAIHAIAPYANPAVDFFFSLQPGDRHAFKERTHDKRQFTHDLIDANLRSGVWAPWWDLVLFGRHWGFELSRIGQPITFYGGSSDVIVPYLHAERQAKRVKNATLRTMEGRGHFAGYTEPELVLADIREHWPRAATPAKKAPAKKAPAKKAPAKKAPAKKAPAKKAPAKKAPAKKAPAKSQRGS